MVGTEVKSEGREGGKEENVTHVESEGVQGHRGKVLGQSCFARKAIYLLQAPAVLLLHVHGSG